MSVNNPALGKTAKDRGKSVGEILNETTIMKEQVRVSHLFTLLRGLSYYVHEGREKVTYDLGLIRVIKEKAVVLRSYSPQNFKIGIFTSS